MPEFLYDVALSFAGTERDYVRGVAEELKRSGQRIFFDEDEEVSLWGENLIERLDEVYREQARFVVMFVSKGYAESVWTRLERRSALTRALTERTAFVLPVRFDDTELPGLLSSVHYINVRGVTGQELAKRIVAKVTGTKREDNGTDADAGWEYLLFAEELDDGVRSLGQLHQDYDMGFARPTGERVESVEDVPSLVKTLQDEMLHWTGNLERILSTENQEAAFGAPGEPGDADSIKHLAGAMTRLYRGLLEWGLRVRGIVVPEEAKSIMWATSRFAEGPIEQYEDFVTDTVTQMRSIVTQLRSGLPPGEPRIVEIHLDFDIPDEVMAEWTVAWKKFERTIRRQRR
jgi:TIR domain